MCSTKVCTWHRKCFVRTQAKFRGECLMSQWDLITQPTLQILHPAHELPLRRVTLEVLKAKKVTPSVHFMVLFARVMAKVVQTNSTYWNCQVMRPSSSLSLTSRYIFYLSLVEFLNALHVIVLTETVGEWRTLNSPNSYLMPRLKISIKIQNNWVDHEWIDVVLHVCQINYYDGQSSWNVFWLKPNSMLSMANVPRTHTRSRH